MSHTTRFVSSGGILLAICAALAGCSSRTNVSATGSTPPQYQHVFITAKEVWFNTSATATAEDSGWAKFPLTTPVSVDLVTQSNGSLGEVINGLQLAPGSYAQIRLIPVDASAALTTSAQALGASFNAEADYVDGTGSHHLALELPNPDKGIGIQATLTVPVGKFGATTGALGTSSTTNSTTNPSTSLFGSTNSTTNPSTSLFGSTNTTTNNTTNTTNSTNTTTNNTTTTGTSGSTTSSTNTTTTVSFAMSFDGSRDLATFTYGGAQGGVGAKSGVLLSAHPAAYDLASAGGISGTLTLTSLTTATITNASNRLNIVATAETLSADGTRHVVVASAPVTTSGTFTLYPLPSNSSTPTTYDVVIHGPGIATMIIKSVPVTVTPPASTSSSTTVSSTATTTATTPVSIGTVIPRAATSFSANVTPTASATLPGGATVSFYQTLSASGEVPYVIEEAAIDPFNFTLGGDEPLSAAAMIDSGTYTSSGAAITLTSATPTEGAGTYGVAASAPLFTDGPISSKVAPPAAGTTTAVGVTVPALTVASGASPTSITASVAQATAGKYDRGEVIVTRDGAIIGTAPLDTALTGGGTVTINGLPGGNSFSSALYDLSVRVWNSKDPAGTLSRQWFSSPVDLRSGSATGVALTIN
ncbi:DUF4382 domain-containing protein [Caballeronia mineralivorans]|uniref:DUF4382 domain-containing protein n=1 Tax=Caballeronia mineralivorans TaxID=2010198 RepID=UPI0023F2E892|nr:DUF4382 domain-containing protein [Caballeronia mineralivorans]MDB5788039.1 hypothetical protein [Caballeronia mineralivorans]